MKKLLILLLSFTAVACATGYHPTYQFNQIQVVNLTGATIEDVNVLVVDSDKTLSCDEVANNAICNDRFGGRRFPQQGIELSWTHPDDNRKSVELDPRIPGTLSSSFAIRIIMEINEDGSVKPIFDQERPARR